MHASLDRAGDVTTDDVERGDQMDSAPAPQLAEQSQSGQSRPVPSSRPLPASPLLRTL